MCASAWDLPSTIAFGACQGATGEILILTQPEQFHSNRLGDAVSLYNPATQQRTDELTQFVSRGADSSTAQERAFKSIESIVRREAYVMAFNDCFHFIGFALLLSGVAILFIKKVKVEAGAGGGH